MDAAPQQKNSILLFLKNYADIIGAIIFGISIGYSIGAFWASYKKTKLYAENHYLAIQIKNLQDFVKEDSVNKDNWAANHAHKVSINALPNDPPLLAVNHQSKQGSNKTLSVIAGDSISFHVTYHNNGDFTIYHPSIGFGIIPVNADTLEFFSGLINGNQILRKDVIKIYVGTANHQFFYPQFKSLYINGKLTRLDSDISKYYLGFPIQDIAPKDTFTAVCNFSMSVIKPH